jgi:hypothetical protein
MKTFHCDKCSQQVFFENTLCFNCNSTLGFQPETRSINAFEPAETPGQWRSLHRNDAGKLYKQCSNYVEYNVCNWMLPADDPHDLCPACQLNVVIPALTSEKNRVLWSRLETAKRRLLFSLATLNLTPASKETEPETGLAFSFMEDGVSDQCVMTGHDNGLITLNIAEADPAERERTREQMHERYRTLLGHFRHESGHYYFDRLVVDSEWIDEYRALFGDERADYGEALKRHYAEGPVADWESRFVSSYASSHPWEDWAETWAHYLHMLDTLETANACGLSLHPVKAAEPALDHVTLPQKTDAFDSIVSDWFALSYALNSLSRSIGMPDAYPFTLSTPVLEKLGFVHKVVRAQIKAPPLTAA